MQNAKRKSSLRATPEMFALRARWSAAGSAPLLYASRLFRKLFMATAMCPGWLPMRRGRGILRLAKGGGIADGRG